jgi:hypothetical protein
MEPLEQLGLVVAAAVVVLLLSLAVASTPMVSSLACVALLLDVVPSATCSACGDVRQ